jgi:tRNA nucleotidyltransferase (CCA-adding enzyme)
LLRAITGEAREQSVPAYIVGGFVRDVLLDIPNLDLDIVVEGSAIRLGESLVRRFGGSLTRHKRFLTAIWYISHDRNKVAAALSKNAGKKLSPGGLPEFVDLITARNETYMHPGALPQVERSGIRQDLYRRDFTVNTLAVCLNPNYGEFLNTEGGYQDLRHKQLRTLHPRSFSDDPTRILRILRLAGRLGFQIERKTLSQMKESLGDLKHVSPQRIYNELFLILQEEKRVSVLRKMRRLGVLKIIHPNLEFDSLHQRGLAHMPVRLPANWQLEASRLAELGFVLWFMHFDKTKAGRLVAHFGMPASLREALHDAIGLKREMKLQNSVPSVIASRLDSMSPLAIYAFFLQYKGTSLGKKVARYNSSWRQIQPYTDGNSLQRMGLAPGPAYSRILDRLRDAWLDGEVKSRREENKFLKSLLEEYK